MELYEQAFYKAAASGHTRIMRALVEEGGVVAAQAACDALIQAVVNDRMEAARLLLDEWGADVNYAIAKPGPAATLTPLVIAIAKRHLDLACMLVVEYQADVSIRYDVQAEPALHAMTALYVASSSGLTELARVIVVEGKADVNQAGCCNGAAPLHAASAGGHIDLCRILLDHGADVDQKDGNGRTPLLEAATFGHAETARLLVTEFNADVDKGIETPLLAAIRSGHIETVRVLVAELGADVNQNLGCPYAPTPLMEAMYTQPAAAMVLVQFGADVNVARNMGGETPLHIAAGIDDIPARRDEAAQNAYVELARVLVINGKPKNIDQFNILDGDPGFSPLGVAAYVTHFPEFCFALCALGASTRPPDGSFGDQVWGTSDPQLNEWLNMIDRARYAPLKIALERRDHRAAIHLLRSRQANPPTAKIIREELLPIASTVGTHALARPVCARTQRVAETAVELHAGDRWSPKVHALCGEGQRQAVMAVMIIMRRAHNGNAGRDSGAVRSRACGGEGACSQYEQVEGLPRWMHDVVDDAWWKVLEMMGLWT